MPKIIDYPPQDAYEALQVAAGPTEFRTALGELADLLRQECADLNGKVAWYKIADALDKISAA
jgi:hypothetical protein